MKKTVTTLMVVSLVGNVFPAFNIAAICSLFPLYLINKESQAQTFSAYGPVTARKFLLAAYVYWIASYVVTGAPITNFFSFDFLRFDGALLIAYLPLLLIIDLQLDPLFIRRTLSLFLDGNVDCGATRSRGVCRCDARTSWACPRCRSLYN